MAAYKRFTQAARHVMAAGTPDGSSTLSPLSIEQWAMLDRLHPEFAEAARRHVGVVARSSELEPKVKAFVALVVDAAVTHLHGPGIDRHIRAALECGATEAEIVEVVECASTLSIHALNFGLPILLDVLRERAGDGSVLATDDDERRRVLREDFTRRRGYWNQTWDELLQLAPDFFASYTDLSSVPWDEGHLPPLTKELLYIAFDTSATHLYAVGLRLHIENAFELGATAAQIVEVMKIASLIGLRAAGEGASALERQRPSTA